MDGYTPRCQNFPPKKKFHRRMRMESWSRQPLTMNSLNVWNAPWCKVGTTVQDSFFWLELSVGVNWSQAPKQRIWGFVLLFKAEFIVGTSIWDDLNLRAPPFHWDVAFCGVFLDHSIQAWWLRCSWKVKCRSFVIGDCFLAKFLDVEVARLHISCKFLRRICRDHGHSPGACCNLFLCNIPDEFLQLQETFELFAEIFSFPACWWKVKIHAIRTP